MTWPVTSRRLSAALGALVAVILVGTTITTPTVAGWADGAVFGAEATGNTWATCQVVRPVTGSVTGTCKITGVTASNGLFGTKISIAVTGSDFSMTHQVKITVDLSNYVPDRTWGAGRVDMDRAHDVSWSAPYLSFTSDTLNRPPYTGTFYASSRTGAEPPNDAAQEPAIDTPTQPDTDQQQPDTGQQQGGTQDPDVAPGEAAAPAAAPTSTSTGRGLKRSRTTRAP